MHVHIYISCMSSWLMKVLMCSYLSLLSLSLPKRYTSNGPIVVGDCTFAMIFLDKNSPSFCHPCHVV